MLGFGQDARGEIYVLGNTTGVPFGDTGMVHRIAKPLRGKERFFWAKIRGRNEVPNPVDTGARGWAFFRFSRDASELEFHIFVSRIDNVIGTHIHLAPKGENGPVVLSMVPDTAGFQSGGPLIPDPGLTPNRTLVKGKVTEADLVGPLEGRFLGDLLREINAGNTYVNIHTVDHRSGEIRGQIR